MRLHIELMGLPGSGKSTLQKEIVKAAGPRRLRMLDLPEAVALCLGRNPADRLLRRGVGRVLGALGRDAAAAAFARSTDRMMSLTTFMAGELALAEIVLSSQRRRDVSRDDSQLVVKWMLGLFARFQFVRDRLTDQEILIMDEGFSNRVTTLFAYALSGSDPMAEIASYVDNIPRPDLVFIVEAGVELCEDRLRRRGWTQRLEALDPAGRTEVLRRSQTCIAVAAARLEQVGVTVVHLSGEESLAPAMKIIGDMATSSAS